MTTLLDVLPDWLIHSRRRGNRPSTVAHKDVALRQFVVCVGDMKVPDVRPRHVDRYFDWLRTERNVSDSTLRSRYLSLNPFFKWLVYEGELTAEQNPMRDMVCPKVPEHPRPVLDKAVREAIQRGTRSKRGRSGFNAIRDRALFAVLEDAGPRAGEVIGVALVDVNLKAGVILLRTTKGGDWRPIPVSLDTKPLLERYLRARASHQFSSAPELWLGSRGPLTYHGLYKALRAAAKRAGVIGIHPHLYRHTFAHEALDAGMPEGMVADLMGHASTEMVHRVYARATAQERAVNGWWRYMEGRTSQRYTQSQVTRDEVKLQGQSRKSGSE